MARFDIPPGVVHEVSKRRNTSNWRETNLVRWEGNTLRPVGGWEQLTVGPFASRVRAMHRWTDNSGILWTAYLCEEHCYVEDASGSLTDITPVDGIEPPVTSGEGGFGDGPFGTDDFGEPRDAFDRTTLASPVFTVDNWGEDLRVMTSADGRLLGWSPSSPTDLLEAVDGAPTGNRSFVVTPERHIMLFGANGNFAQFIWSDQEDDSEWTPGTTTKAGGFVVEPAAPIITQIKVSNGVLMFTGRGAYIIEYVGAPFYYNYSMVVGCPPPVSASTIVTIPDGALWAAINGVWLYNGVSAAPVDCPVWDWVTNSINPAISKREATAVTIPARFEVWFFFTGGEESSANNRVVIYNYAKDKWSMGLLGRTCGSATVNDPFPLMSDGVKVYKHESGFQYPGAVELPWAETFSLNLGGTKMLTLKQMLPELDGGKTAVRFRFIKSTNPTSGPETYSSPKTIRDNGYVDIRETALDFRMRVEMVQNKEWSFGPFELTVAGRGDK